MNHGITIVEKFNVHAPTFMILYVSFLTLGIWKRKTLLIEKRTKF